MGVYDAHSLFSYGRIERMPKKSKQLTNTTAHPERTQAYIKKTTALLGKTETEVIYLAN